MKRYFEFVGEDKSRGVTSSKFWEVWIEGTTVYTRFGKIGVNGQTTVKEFPSVDGAQAALDKLVSEKLKKGYLEAGGTATTPAIGAPSESGSGPDPNNRWNAGELFEIASQGGPGKEAFAEYSSSISILTTLAQDDATSIRGNVAESPNTPVNILTTLARDDDEDVLIALMHNPTSPLPAAVQAMALICRADGEEE